MFSKDETAYCWEDFDNDSKEKYPVRFFIFKTIGGFFRSKAHRLEMFLHHINEVYFAKCHKIDISNSLTLACGNFFDYKYKNGYIDPYGAIESCIYKVFKKYYDAYDIDERINMLNDSINSSTSDDEKEIFSKELQMHFIVKEVNDFFDNIVPQKAKEFSAAWDNVRNDGDGISKLCDLEKEFEQEWEEKLISIIKIRRGLWH